MRLIAGQDEGVDGAPHGAGRRGAGYRTAWRRHLQRGVGSARSFAALTPGARRLMLGTLALNVGVGVSSVLFNLFLMASGRDLAFIGLAAALATIIQAAVAPLTGWAMRRLGVRRVLALGAAAWACGTALSVLAPAAPAILLGVALSGVGFSAATIPAGPAMITLATASGRMRLFSVYSGATTVGGMLGALLSGTAPALAALALGVHGQPSLAADRLGLLLGAAIAALGVAFLWRVQPPPATPGADEAGRVIAPGPDALPGRRLSVDIAVMLAATGLIAATLGATMPFCAIYFVTQLHIAAATVGLVVAASGLICTVAALLSPAAGRWGSVVGFNGTRLASAPLLALMALHPTLGVAVGAYAGRNALGTISGALENVFAMEAMPARLRGAVAGWRACAFNGGWSLGSIVTGAVAARVGYEPIFTAASVLTVIATVWYYARFAPRRSPRARVAASLSRAMRPHRLLAAARTRLS